ncbi:MAG: recombination protein RecR [Saprospiraceae bacterium]|nr:recombination protein RecR [Candidatus Vicinibacter affinis]
MKYTSKLMQDAVEALSTLPGVGKKTALRLAIFLAQQDASKSHRLSSAIQDMVDKMQVCKVCFSYSDSEICEICANPARDQTTFCVIESIRDLIAIEETQQYKGLYHVLGGLISPIEGIGPDKLNILPLFKRVQDKKPKEIIMAIRPSIEGDTTVYYITKQIDTEQTKISLIARGISFGSELEYADEFTLSRSIASRTPYFIKDNSAV